MPTAAKPHRTARMGPPGGPSARSSSRVGHHAGIEPDLEPVRGRALRLWRRESPMFFVNRPARKSNERRSSHGFYRPRCEGLEDRLLLTIDLGRLSSPKAPTRPSPTLPSEWISQAAASLIFQRPYRQRQPARASLTWATSMATDLKTTLSPQRARTWGLSTPRTSA